MHVRRLLPEDAIPSVDAPAFSREYFGDPDDEVVVVEPASGPARAYPLRVLHYHEVVNDVLEGDPSGGPDRRVGRRGDDGTDGDGTAARSGDQGPGGGGMVSGNGDPGTDGDGTAAGSGDQGPGGGGMASGNGDRGTDGDGTATGSGRPIAVTWCPICASAVVYDRTVEGDVLEFGVSGKLADDDLVLYDRRRGSEWKQSSGAAIAGPHEGETLSVLPASIVPYRRFAAAHPDGVVLDPAASDTDVADAAGARRYYDAAPYEAYFERGGFGYEAIKGQAPARDWDRDDLDAKTTVLGLGDGEDAVAVPLPLARARRVVELTVGDRDVVVLADGDAVGAFEAPPFRIEPGDDGDPVGDGTAWDPATGEGGDGRRLDRVPTRRLFAFAWQDDHGADRFYGVSGDFSPSTA